jgi:hypothetical protein
MFVIGSSNTEFAFLGRLQHQHDKTCRPLYLKYKYEGRLRFRLRSLNYGGRGANPSCALASAFADKGRQKSPAKSTLDPKPTSPRFKVSQPRMLRS